MKNNYRKISHQSILDISEIIQYRNLAIPIKTIKKLKAMDIDGILTIMQVQKDTLHREMIALKGIQEQTDLKIALIQRVHQLRRDGFSVEERTFEEIKQFAYDNPKHLKIYVDEPIKTVVFFTKDCIQSGIITDDETEIIRAKDSHPKQYLKGLLVIEKDNLAHNNMNEFRLEAKRRGYHSKDFMAIYYLSATQNYYEGWLELV